MASRLQYLGSKASRLQREGIEIIDTLELGMSFRPGEIYVQRNTKRRLRWVAEIEREHDNTQSTMDQVADRLLNERIEQIYPNIAKLEKELDSVDSAIIQRLVDERAV